MIALIRRPMKLLIAVLVEDGVLCLIPGNVDECERLAHQLLVSVSVSQPLALQMSGVVASKAPFLGRWKIAEYWPLGSWW